MLRVLITKTGGQETGVTLVTADKVSLGRIVRQKWITPVMISHVKTMELVHRTGTMGTTHTGVDVTKDSLEETVKQNIILPSTSVHVDM
jgi:hypothetical protein